MMVEMKSLMIRLEIENSFDFPNRAFDYFGHSADIAEHFFKCVGFPDDDFSISWSLELDNRVPSCLMVARERSP